MGWVPIMDSAEGAARTSAELPRDEASVLGSSGLMINWNITASGCSDTVNLFLSQHGLARG